MAKMKPETVVQNNLNKLFVGMEMFQIYVVDDVGCLVRQLSEIAEIAGDLLALKKDVEKKLRSYSRQYERLFQYAEKIDHAFKEIANAQENKHIS